MNTKLLAILNALNTIKVSGNDVDTMYNIKKYIEGVIEELQNAPCEPKEEKENAGDIQD